MSWYTRRDFRKIHRWGAVLIALPFLIVLISGLILQVKKEFNWIQPPTMEGSVSNETPSISFERILDISKSVEEANINTWEDIDRLDLRPDKGIVKIRSNSNWEIQIDLANGDILYSSIRRSDIIESLHDGSWFHNRAKLWVFLPVAVVVTILWITGVYLFFLPYFARWQNRKLLAERIRKRRKENIKKDHKKAPAFEAEALDE